MLDHLSEGRFEFGTGRGSSTHRVQGLRHPRRRDDARDVRRGAAARSCACGARRPYSYEGTYFSMPRAERAAEAVLASRIRRIWVACGSPSTFEKAARLGLGALCFSLGSPKDFEPLIKTYKDDIRHAEPIGDYVNDNVACVTAARLPRGPARRRAEIALEHGQRLPHEPRLPVPRHVPAPAAACPTGRSSSRSPTPEQLEERIASGQRIVGDPDECAAGGAEVRRRRLRPAHLRHPRLDASRRTSRSHTVELFGTQVIPRFDKDPVHSTTRIARPRSPRRRKAAAR